MKSLIKFNTKFPGVRFYEHPTRKHHGKPDRYFSIRYRMHGKQHEEGMGWSSEDMSASEAFQKLSELKKARRTGEGPTSLRDKREQHRNQALDKAKEKLRQKREKITFNEAWKQYAPVQQETVIEDSWRREFSLFRIWISPAIGQMPMININQVNLQKIRHDMEKAGRTPRSICYALDVVRQVFNFANKMSLINCQNPTKGIKKPHKDNKRHRYLTVDEADRLLSALKKKSQELYEASLVSLHCGLRAGEIFALKWSDVDLQTGRLNLMDTKGGRNRHPLMTDQVKEVFLKKEPGSPGDLVFPSRNDKIRKAISKVFAATVSELGLNKNCIGTRDKVVFHTLRHTFASWLVQSGIPIYEVGKHLGHSTIAVTERYAHLAPHNFENSVKVIENI